MELLQTLKGSIHMNNSAMKQSIFETPDFLQQNSNSSKTNQ